MWSRIRKLFSGFLKRPDLSLGEMGEQAAVNFLRKKKMKIVDRNIEFPMGEIDIVAIDQRTVVFVEVKTRRSDKKGAPWEAVDQAKQAKIMKTAQAYLRREELTDQKARFDIVSVTWLDGQRKPDIEHLMDAFDGNDMEDQSP